MAVPLGKYNGSINQTKTGMLLACGSMLSVRLVSRNRLTITALIVIFTIAANEEINEDELEKITANKCGSAALRAFLILNTFV